MKTLGKFPLITASSLNSFVCCFLLPQENCHNFQIITKTVEHTMFRNKISDRANLFLSVALLFSKVPEYLNPQICLLCKGELQKDENKTFAAVLSLFEQIGKKRRGLGDSWRRPVGWQWWRRLANSLNNCAPALGISQGWHSPPAFPSLLGRKIPYPCQILWIFCLQC